MEDDETKTVDAKAPSQLLTCLTWNCEGLRRNVFILSEFLNTRNPSLAFLCEPQTYQCELRPLVQYIERDYCYSLNSEDLYEPELPLHKNRAKGGTMVLWRRDLDPYVKVIPVNTAAFLPIVLTLPETRPSVHVSLPMVKMLHSFLNWQA